jgi:hypothetical protein
MGTGGGPMSLGRTPQWADRGGHGATPHRQSLGFRVGVATPIGTEPPELPEVSGRISHRPCGGPTTGPGSSPPDIDYPWTYIGGSTELIDEPLADDRLEVLPARLTDKPFHDSDTVNARLDDRGGQP